MVGEETVEQGETVAAQNWAEMVLLHSSERCKEQESPKTLIVLRCSGEIVVLIPWS